MTNKLYHESSIQTYPLPLTTQITLQDLIRDRDILTIEREFHDDLLQALEKEKRNKTQ
jgi:hypothetical protein